ncbi:UNVERIFIED_CONTAM: hypothetical protein PYX00_004833 [Menopon gallinae]|uniref:Uncharacterized protein n=1 Tax=Menopon gallinae TaxID=328185 RepID=A0AAW2I813_9NEOP
MKYLIFIAFGLFLVQGYPIGDDLDSPIYSGMLNVISNVYLNKSLSEDILKVLFDKELAELENEESLIHKLHDINSVAGQMCFLDAFISLMQDEIIAYREFSKCIFNHNLLLLIKIKMPECSSFLDEELAQLKTHFLCHDHEVYCFLHKYQKFLASSYGNLASDCDLRALAEYYQEILLKHAEECSDDPRLYILAEIDAKKLVSCSDYIIS